MPRAGYRSGEKRVDVWLSSVQHAHLARLAEAEGCSLSDMVGSLIREKVMRDADGDAGRGVRGAAAADGGGPRDVPERGGSGDARERAADVAVALTPHAEVMASITKAEEIARMVDAALERPRLTLVPPPLIGAEEPPLPFDAFESDTLPAGRDSRGRVLAPIIRDEFIDVP